MLVEIKGKKNEEQLVASSKEVSASFEKQHYHVIRDIEGMKKDVSNFGAMFCPIRSHEHLREILGALFVVQL